MSPKPIHLIIGEDPSDVKLLVGEVDLVKESLVYSIKFEIQAGDIKKLTVEFCEFTADIAVSPSEVTGVLPPDGLPKWMPEANIDSFSLAT